MNRITPWNKGKTGLQVSWCKGKVLPKKYAVRKCLNCGIEFYRSDATTRYCSVRCVQASPVHWEVLSRALKGRVSNNKGKVLSLEQRAKIRAHNARHWLGKKRAPDVVAAISGSRNWNWKGGITPIHEKIRRSPEYKEWRRQVFEQDDYRCFDCGERGVTLHADHILPFALFPRLRFDVNNGRTLCVECHRATATFGGRALQTCS